MYVNVGYCGYVCAAVTAEMEAFADIPEQSTASSAAKAAQSSVQTAQPTQEVG